MSVLIEIYKLPPTLYCDILNWLLDKDIPFKYTPIWERDDKFEYIRMIEVEEQDAIALRLKFGL